MLAHPDQLALDMVVWLDMQVHFYICQLADGLPHSQQRLQCHTLVCNTTVGIKYCITLPETCKQRKGLHQTGMARRWQFRRVTLGCLLVPLLMSCSYSMCQAPHTQAYLKEHQHTQASAANAMPCMMHT